ncbi:hypothetical protein [Chitinimonas naiadis]
MNGVLIELKRNPRLRLGLLVVIGILLLNLLLGMREENQRLHAKERELAQRLARLGQNDLTPAWLKRKDEIATVLSQEQTKLWSAPSEGRAQAFFQDWVTTQFGAAKIPRFNMKLADGGVGFGGRSLEDSLPAGVKRVRLKVDFDFDPVSNLEWMKLIESEPRSVQFESLTMHRPRIETVLVAYFRIEPDKRAGEEKAR